MRIWVLTDFFPPETSGGYELRCREHVLELRRRGHDVRVLCAGGGESDPRGGVYRWLRRLGRRGGGLANRPGAVGFVFRRIRQLRLAFVCRLNYRAVAGILDADPPDVAYIWQLRAEFVNALAALQSRGIPAVLNIGDYWLARLCRELREEKRTLIRAWRNRVLKTNGLDWDRIVHILVNSEALKRAYIESGFPGGAIQVIPRGIRRDQILGEAAAAAMGGRSGSSEVRLVFAGRLAPEKGPDLAIRAAAELMGSPDSFDFRLDIIGTGDSRFIEELSAMIRRFGLNGRVRLLGRMDHETLLGRLSEYDAMIVPPRWEDPFPVSVLEAMARGCLVIATGRGGIPEIIENGRNGVIVSGDEPGAIAAEIMRIVRHPQIKREMERNARETVLRKFAFEKTMDDSERFIRQSIALPETARSS